MTGMNLRRALTAAALAGASILGAAGLGAVAHAAEPRDGWPSRPEQGPREGRTTQRVVVANGSPEPVIIMDLGRGTAGGDPLWSDDAAPPDGFVIEPSESVALELTVGGFVRIRLAEPDENPESHNSCDSYRPMTIVVQPDYGSLSLIEFKPGSLELGSGHGRNVIWIDAVSGGPTDRSRPITVGCPLSYDPEETIVKLSITFPRLRSPWS
jgi:hypothetical protein